MSTLRSPWGRQFRVEAEVTINSLPPRGLWSSIFHFTQGGDRQVPGDRIPMLQLKHTGYFHFASTVSGNRNKTFDYRIEIGKRYRIKIEQKYERWGTMYSIWINGRKVFWTKNHSPQDFRNVKVYTTDPWYDTLDGFGILHILKWTDSL